MKHSALHNHHERSGAIWADRYGWRLPASFGDVDREVAQARQGVAVADLSCLQKFESPQPHLGSWKLAAKRHLVMGEPPWGTPPAALDITSVYSVFLIAGPRSREVLRKLTSIDLSESAFPNSHCGQASLAHAHSIIIREDLGDLWAYKTLVTRDYAESVWESILHAGHELHIQRFGLEALDRLRP